MKSKKIRWFDKLAHSAQSFRGTGKGIGKGRGPRLAEVPESGTDRGTDREKVRSGFAAV